MYIASAFALTSAIYTFKRKKEGTEVRGIHGSAFSFYSLAFLGFTRVKVPYILESAKESKEKIY